MSVPYRDRNGGKCDIWCNRNCPIKAREVCMVKEAVLEIMNYLFSQGYENILCTYSEGNNKSKRVSEKIGFKLFSIEENAWIKNGISVTEYKTVLSKKDFYAKRKIK